MQFGLVSRRVSDVLLSSRRFRSKRASIRPLPQLLSYLKTLSPIGPERRLHLFASSNSNTIGCSSQVSPADFTTSRVVRNVDECAKVLKNVLEDVEPLLDVLWNLLRLIAEFALCRELPAHCFRLKTFDTEFSERKCRHCAQHGSERAAASRTSRFPTMARRRRETRRTRGITSSSVRHRASAKVRTNPLIAMAS